VCVYVCVQKECMRGLQGT